MDRIATEERMMLERRVEKIFLKELQVEVPDPETDVIDAGLVDSLGFVRLLTVLEREFELDVDLERLDLDDFRTVARIAGFLEKQTGVTPAEPAPASVAGD